MTVGGAGWFTMALPGKGEATTASKVFLPGTTTHGHHQIEMSCKTCHTPDGEITDQSCLDCHGADLKKSRDTHPKSKFVDPTKAELLQKIDASNCLTCHIEHQEEQTHAMGVTVPMDYCIHCHEDVGQDRPSHVNLAFDTCANAGCHNYHDNTALYENFLNKHYGQSDLLDSRIVPERRLQQWLAREKQTATTDEADSVKKPAAKDSDSPHEWNFPAVASDWATSGHALAGVNCSACHTQDVSNFSELEDAAAAEHWIEKPDHTSCQQCHDEEVDGFLMGKHGMRLSVGLSEMTPELARHPMHAGAAHQKLNCSACHDPHRPNLQFAAVESCLSCHDDDHSQAYLESSHFSLWNKELSGEAGAGTGVSCATCHMPRGEDGRVQHNQNANLQPNEKMIRTSCMNCHGVQFSLNALADPELKSNCYSTAPGIQIASPKMVHDWFESRKRKKKK